MQLIYQNKYGACFRVYNAPNPDCKIQMVVDSIGIFMSEPDLQHLLEIVRNSDQPCYCSECNGQTSNKIWCTGPLHDIALKFTPNTLPDLEDLLVGTQFMMRIDEGLAS